MWVTKVIKIHLQGAIVKPIIPSHLCVNYTHLLNHSNTNQGGQFYSVMRKGKFRGVDPQGKG